MVKQLVRRKESESKDVQREHTRRVMTLRGPRNIMINRGVRKPMTQTSGFVRKVSERPLVVRPRPTAIKVLKVKPIKGLKEAYESYRESADWRTVLWFEKSPLGPGLAVMPLCPLCRNPSGFILFQKDPSKDFPATPVMTITCEDCWNKYLRKGVMIIPGDKNRKPLPAASVIKEEAFKRMFLNPHIPKGRTIMVPLKVYNKILTDGGEKPFDMNDYKKKVDAGKSIKTILKDIKDSEKKSKKANEEMNKVLKGIIPDKDLKEFKDLDRKSRKATKEFEDDLRKEGLI